MKFNQFVIRNTLRNRHLYFAYFLSTLFSVMVFFTFNVFANHPNISNGLKASVNTGMNVASVIIYGFSFFFVLYSMDIFLQSRKKEFGLLMMQGMSPRQLRGMVFIENLVIGCISTLSGTILGIGFAQIILVLSKEIMHISLGFYFPTQAIIITLISFLILFLLISIFIQFKLPRLQLQELLKSQELGKGELKPSLIKSILALILIGGGYGVALMVPGVAVPLVMLPVVTMVILGSYLLFNQLSVWIVERLKKNKQRFWKKTNMLVFSDLAFRMKDNARAFFLVSVISTVAFASIGSLYSFKQIIVKEVDKIPYDFSYQGDVTKAKAFSNKFTRYLDNKGFESDETSVSYIESNSAYIMSEKAYNQLAKSLNMESVQVRKDALRLVYENQTTGNQEVGNSPLTVGNQTFSVQKKMVKKAILSSYFSLYILSNQDFDAIKTAESTKNFVIWQAPKISYDQKVALGQKFEKEANLTSTTYMSQKIISSFAPILFVGLFIGIVFFVSAGSFLYFRLYSDIEVDIQKFKMVYKIGLTKQELKKMVYQQVGILFFTPILLSLLHGVVALTAMYHIFGLGIQGAAFAVLGTFLLIQAVYYFVARYFYFKKVYAAII